LSRNSWKLRYHVLACCIGLSKVIKNKFLLHNFNQLAYKSLVNYNVFWHLKENWNGMPSHFYFRAWMFHTANYVTIVCFLWIWIELNVFVFCTDMVSNSHAKNDQLLKSNRCENKARWVSENKLRYYEFLWITWPRLFLTLRDCVLTKCYTEVIRPFFIRTSAQRCSRWENGLRRMFWM
jgi:hypothetical protein